MQDALALRDKLVKWKEEKAKKNESQRTSVAWKFAFQPPTSRTSTSREHLRNSISAHKNVTHSNVGRRTTMTSAVAQGAKSLATKGINAPPSKHPRQSRSIDAITVSGMPPTSRRSVAGPKRGVGRIQKILQTVVTDSRGEKENQATAVSQSYHDPSKSTGSSTKDRRADKVHTAVRKSFAGKATVAVTTKAQSLAQQPRKSILKHVSGIVSESVTGTSSFISGVHKSFSNPDKTTDTGIKFALGKDEGHDGGSEKEAGRVTFVAGVSAEGQGAHFRKTPAMTTKDGKTQEGLRARLKEWRTSNGLTPSIHHAGCFHSNNNCTARPTPRSQVKPSITVEQLSRQENTLVQEDLKKNLAARFNTAASQRSSSDRSVVPMSRTPSCSSTSIYAAPDQQDAETGKLDVSWDIPTSSECSDLENQDSAGHAAPEFDTESWDIGRLDSDFDRCLAALEAKSLSADAALGWLGSVQEAYSDVKYNIGWCKCRVAALKATGDVDGVLEVFEQAIISNVQPAEEMAGLLTRTMKEMLASQNTRKRRGRSSTFMSKSAGTVTRKRHLSHQGPLLDVQKENMFRSTTVKYSVVEVTPFTKRRRGTDCGERLVPVVTPVRRSTRLRVVKTTSFSEGRARAATHQFAREYTALHDVPSAEKEKMLFHPNKALEPLILDDCGEQEVFENQE